MAVETITRQNIARRRVHVPATRSVLNRRDGRRLRLQYPPVPAAYARRRPANEVRSGYVAAIVGEYSTQVQYHQRIFPQAFASCAGMRQSGPFTERHDGLERCSGSPTLLHLVLDLRGHLNFPYTRLQHASRGLHHLTRKEGRATHGRQFYRLFAHPQTCDKSRRPAPRHALPGGVQKRVVLRHGKLSRVKTDPASTTCGQELPYRRV